MLKFESFHCLREDVYLDFKVLHLDLGSFNYVPQFLSLRKRILVLPHRIEVFLDLGKSGFKVCQLFFLSSLESRIQLNFLIMTLLTLVSEGDIFVVEYFMLVVSLLGLD